MDVKDLARARAASREDDLAAAAAAVERFKEDYPNGLPIEINLWVALLSGKILQKLFGTKQTFTAEGIVVERTFGGGPDRETFGVARLASAEKPDIDYIWITDWIRRGQSVYNTILGWMFGRVKLLDWGASRVKFIEQGGGATIELIGMQHPKASVDWMLAEARKLNGAQTAFNQLVDRYDRHR